MIAKMRTKATMFLFIQTSCVHHTRKSEMERMLAAVNDSSTLHNTTLETLETSISVILP